MFAKRYDEVEKVEATEDGARGASIRWVLGPKEGMPNFHLRVVELEPGGQSMHHQHDYEHEVFALDGTGEIVGDGITIPLTPGTAAYVSPGEIHQFRNTGDDIFKFICVIPSLEE